MGNNNKDRQMTQEVNPLRWLMCIAVFVLLFDVAQIYLDATVSGTGEVVGIPFHSRGPLNPIAPFRIIAVIVYLYLYHKRSTLAWHVLLMTTILSFPAYLILRLQGIYFKPDKFTTRDLFTLVAWITLALYIIKLRSPYIQFLSCGGTSVKENEEDEESAPTDDYRPFGREMCKSHEQIRFGQTFNTFSIKPETQIQMGKFAASLVIIYATYLLVIHRIYMAVARGISAKYVGVAAIYLTLGFLIPIGYVWSLVYRKLRSARIVYRIWLVFVLLAFVFVGFHRLILMGDFSDFLPFWGPLGVTTIFWWVGVRGLTRIEEPETESKHANTVSNISMYIGMFLGFFCNGKITHDLLASYWPDVPYYYMRWFLPCLVGGIAGSCIGAFAGAYAGAFLGFFIDRLQKAKATSGE